MKQVPITPQLKQFFRSCAQTLIMEGYCNYFDDVAVYNDGDSYALIATISPTYRQCCMYTASTSFIDEVLAMLDGEVEFYGVPTFVTDYVSQKYAFKWLTNCTLYVWDGQPLDTTVINCNIRPLDPSYAQMVSDGTPYHADLDNVRKCLAMHPSAAVYVDGNAVCWCLLHQEGSLGMLYTLPEHRRKGYALQVMTAISDMVIKSGNVPYAYIIQGNTASEKLAPKYNLRPVGKADYFLIDKGEHL